MLRGELVNLRLLRASDVSDFLTLYNGVLNPCFSFPESFKKEHSLLKQLNSSGCWNDHRGLMIIESNTQQMLGVLSYYKPNSYYQGLELAFAIFKRRHRGRGFIKEALSLFADYLMREKPINRLQISIVAKNEYSHKIAEQIGFRQEGCYRQVIFENGQFEDIAIYALLREEWQQQKMPFSVQHQMNGEFESQ